MRFFSTPVIRIHALHDLLRTEQPVWFDDRTLSMHPFGLNRIEPWTFTRQQAGQHPYPLPRLLDLLIVLAQPGTDSLTLMPRRIIPNQQHGGEPLRRQTLTAP